MTKAIIIKNIELETRDIPNNHMVYKEAVIPPLGASTKEGEHPCQEMTFPEEIYTRSQLCNPETGEKKNYYVKLDDRDLWKDLTVISDEFVNSKINDGIEQEHAHIKSLPWYKRLFNNF